MDPEVTLPADLGLEATQAVYDGLSFPANMQHENEHRYTTAYMPRIQLPNTPSASACKPDLNSRSMALFLHRGLGDERSKMLSLVLRVLFLSTMQSL